MIVYHGSSMEVKNPEITHSKAFLDFRIIPGGEIIW